MVRMTNANWTDVPADVAAERSAIETEIDGSTLLTAYAQTVEEHPDVVAHQWLDGGQWRTLTYRQVHDRVRDAALGLAAIGLRPGDFAAVWSGNRSEATISDYAVMHAGGVPVFIYPTVSAEQAAYIAGHCEATVAIVERQYLDKLESVRDQLPKLRQIVVIDPEGDPGIGDGLGIGNGSGADNGRGSGVAGVIGWSRLLDLGRAEAEVSPGLFEENWRHVTPDDLATLIYTSGTTGTPKAAMLTHRNVRYTQAASLRFLPIEARSGADGVGMLVSFLPMAHVTGRSTDHWSSLAHPVTLSYCPDSKQIFAIAAQVRPTTLIAVPRIWEKLYAGLRPAVPDPSPEAVRALPDEVKASVLTLVGLDRCVFAASGAAPIDPGIIEFFQALGLPITEGWGMSELCNAATSAAPGDSRNGAVGRAYPGVEVRIADDGEVLVRGPLVMGGYYHDKERTAEAVDADGWMHTGDIGELDAEGFLKITDRKKDLLITSGGTNISPALVEYELQRHPLIGQACAIGDRRKYVAALLVLDPDVAPAWARDHGVEFSSPAELAADPRVLAEIERGVADANSHLARPEQVRRYAVLADEWTALTGELTPSLKRRRPVITEKYAKEIAGLYGE
jgi:long-chain acyl-CoA synthetase